MSTGFIESRAILHSLNEGNLATLTKELSSLEKDELLKVLQKVCDEASSAQDPIALIDRLAEVVSLDKLEGAAKEQYAEFTDTIAAAKEMFSSAKYYLEKQETGISISLKARLLNFFNSCLLILENILNAFGIADFFLPQRAKSTPR